jgi:hypothetical protein
MFNCNGPTFVIFYVNYSKLKGLILHLQILLFVTLCIKNSSMKILTKGWSYLMYGFLITKDNDMHYKNNKNNKNKRCIISNFMVFPPNHESAFSSLISLA